MISSLYNCLIKITNWLDGRFFITEPKIHVSLLAFHQIMRKAQVVGFEIAERSSMRFGRTVLLVKSRLYLSFSV